MGTERRMKARKAYLETQAEKLSQNIPVVHQRDAINVMGDANVLCVLEMEYPKGRLFVDGVAKVRREFQKVCRDVIMAGYKSRVQFAIFEAPTEAPENLHQIEKYKAQYPFTKGALGDVKVIKRGQGQVAMHEVHDLGPFFEHQLYMHGFDFPLVPAQAHIPDYQVIVDSVLGALQVPAVQNKSLVLAR